MIRNFKERVSLELSNLYIDQTKKSIKSDAMMSHLLNTFLNEYIG